MFEYIVQQWSAAPAWACGSILVCLVVVSIATGVAADEGAIDTCRLKLAVVLGLLAMLAASAFAPTVLGWIVALSVGAAALGGLVYGLTMLVSGAILGLDDVPVPDDIRMAIEKHRAVKATNRSLSRTGAPRGCPDTALSRPEECP